MKFIHVLFTQDQFIFTWFLKIIQLFSHDVYIGARDFFRIKFYTIFTRFPNDSFIFKHDSYTSHFFSHVIPTWFISFRNDVYTGLWFFRTIHLFSSDLYTRLIFFHDFYTPLFLHVVIFLNRTLIFTGFFFKHTSSIFPYDIYRWFVYFHDFLKTLNRFFLRSWFVCDFFTLLSWCLFHTIHLASGLLPFLMLFVWNPVTFLLHVLCEVWVKQELISIRPVSWESWCGSRRWLGPREGKAILSVCAGQKHKRGEKENHSNQWIYDFSLSLTV